MLKAFVRSSPARRRGESGVIAIVTSLVTCFTLVPLAAFAVDIGVQRVARRDIQVVADVVSLDLARQLDGRTAQVIAGGLQTLADKSAARNSAGTGAVIVEPQLGVVDEAAYDPDDPEAYFTPVSGTAVPNAVKVTASTSVDFSISTGRGGVARSSIAKSQKYACFSIGSFALNMSSAQSLLLKDLLNDALNLSVVSYSGLANAEISLYGLATNLGVGTPTELADLSNLSLNDLFLASAQVLQSEGGEAADVTLLNQLATANLSALAHVTLGDILDLNTAPEAALDATVNVLDLVSTAAFVANGTNALAIPTLTAGIPNVSSVTASLKVIEKPQDGCHQVGDTIRTSQVDLDITFTLANLNVLAVVVAQTTLSVHVSLAEALGTLTNIECGTPYGIDVSVASALSQLSTHLQITLRTLGIPIATVDVMPTTNAPAATNTIQFRNPPDLYDVAKSTGSGTALSTISLTTGDIQVLGLPLGVTTGGLLTGITNSLLTPIINPLIANTNAILVGPLSDLLGVNLGGADLFVHEPPAYACNGVAMAG
jgi:uncharacterized membrane protein